MGTKRVSRSLFGLLGLVVALLVAGCGSGSSGGGSADGDDGPEGSPATFQEGACTPGGTFVVGLEEEPATLLGGSVRQTTGTTRLARMVYSQLLELDPEGELRASLAEKWDVSDDGLTYTFELDPRATWHDGEPVTSEDVAATMAFLKDAPLDTVVWDLIDAVETPDAQTAVMQLKEPYAGFLTAVANPNDSGWILPAHHIVEDMEKSPLAREPVGSGPFRFVSWDRGTQIELERNPDYFEEGRPCVDRVVTRFMPDAASRKIAFDSGEVDWLYSYMVPLEELPRYEAQQPEAVVEGGLGTAVSDFLLLNTKHRYLRDVQVREAIFRAIDREQLNELAFYGFGEVAHSTINSTLEKFYTDEYDTYDLNVEQANALLDEAGVARDADGHRFTLNIRVRPDRPFEPRIGEALRTQLAEVGINVELKPGDAASVYDLVYSKFDFDAVVQLHTTGPDPGTQIPVMFGKAGIGAPAGNGGRYVDRELERLFAEAATELDPERQRELWNEIQEQTMKAFVWLPLVEYPNVQLISPEFENVIVGPLDYLGNLEFVRQAG